MPLVEKTGLESNKPQSLSNGDTENGDDHIGDFGHNPKKKVQPPKQEVTSFCSILLVGGV